MTQETRQQRIQRALEALAFTDSVGDRLAALSLKSNVRRKQKILPCAALKMFSLVWRRLLSVGRGSRPLPCRQLLGSKLLSGIGSAIRHRKVRCL
jgi:hypothetical protein